MKKHGQLFLTMLKIGLFTFGGGYAMIALLEQELVEQKQWMTKSEFLDMVAIAESTPGPISINAATYVGCKRDGVRGAVLATAAVCIPSFVILYGISLFLDAFLSLTLVARAFQGIRVCVVYLILRAAWKLWRQMEKTTFTVVLFGTVTACMTLCSLGSVHFSTVVSILLCGCIGVVGYLLRTFCKNRRNGQ